MTPKLPKYATKAILQGIGFFNCTSGSSDECPSADAGGGNCQQCQENVMGKFLGERR